MSWLYIHHDVGTVHWLYMRRADKAEREGVCSLECKVQSTRRADKADSEGQQCCHLQCSLTKATSTSHACTPASTASTRRFSRGLRCRDLSILRRLRNCRDELSTASRALCGRIASH
jgi:hypothetical protein